VRRLRASSRAIGRGNAIDAAAQQITIKNRRRREMKLNLKTKRTIGVWDWARMT